MLLGKAVREVCVGTRGGEDCERQGVALKNEDTHRSAVAEAENHVSLGSSF